MAVRMLGKPISRYSSRVLKTAPSQWVGGMRQKVGGACSAARLELSALNEAKGNARARIRQRLIMETFFPLAHTHREHEPRTYPSPRPSHLLKGRGRIDGSFGAKGGSGRVS